MYNFINPIILFMGACIADCDYQNPQLESSLKQKSRKSMKDDRFSEADTEREEKDVLKEFIHNYEKENKRRKEF